MCSFANASASCLRGTCFLGTCNAGFGNCDTVAANGCEANLNTSTMHCGACGMACTAPTNGTVSCVVGVCRQSCNVGYYPIALGAGIVCAPIQPPKQLDPSSFGLATTRRPTFRWAHVSPTNGARLQVCTTRACTSILLDVNATGTSYTPTADLPAGRLYWRLFGLIGSNQGATVSPAWTMHVSVRSAARDAAFGVTPDFNGDGFSDFAVWDEFSSGQPVRVFNGSATGLPTAATQNLFGATGSGFGTSVAPAGDVNGDGYGDLIVGAPNLVTAYVYLGSATGLGTRVTLTGAIRTGFGGAVSWAGDTNDDGYGDVIVGACSPSICEGAAYVFHGTSTGVSTTAARRLVSAGTTRFGSFVRGAGEVNNDEADDVVVGHSAGFVQFLGTATAGTSFSVAGLTDLDFAWDVNGDGYGDVAVVFPSRTTAVVSVLRIFHGFTTGLALASTVSVVVNGDPRVAGLGDVNGDGFSDVAWSAIGAWVRVHHGAAGGIANTPTFDRTPVGAEGSFGWQLWHGGSVNGDGLWDLLYEYTTFSPCQRYIRSHHGSTGGVLFTPTTTLIMPGQCIG
jgi:hypothetical protein